MSDQHGTDDTEHDSGAAATLFDLRTVIAILFGVYGVVLLIISLVGTSKSELAKAGGVHINLWSSIVMILASAVFFTWTRMRPPMTGHIEEDLTTPDTPSGSH